MPSAQVNLAQLYLELGKPVDADRHYRRAVAQLPAGNDARLALARLLVDQGRGEQATQLLRDGLPASSQPGPLHFALGLIAGKAGRWAEAAAELERAARLMPDDARVRRNLEAVRQRLPRPAPGNPPQ
jgi:Flp pilus assembly protein TadD